MISHLFNQRLGLSQFICYNYFFLLKSWHRTSGLCHVILTGFKTHFCDFISSSGRRMILTLSHSCLMYPWKDMAIFARNICNQFLSFPPTTLLEPRTRMVVPLCSVFLRPHLEYWSLLWVGFGLDGLHMSFPTWISLWSMEVTVRTMYAVIYLKLRTLLLRTGCHANAILTHVSLPLFLSQEIKKLITLPSKPPLKRCASTSFGL